MKRIKLLVASALILSSMTTLVACGKDTKGEEVASVDTVVEETQEEETSKEESTEENKENAEEVKEEAKEEVAKNEETAKAQAEQVKENTNTETKSTSQPSNNVQSNTNQKETVKQAQPQKQPEQPQKNQETPKYCVGEVVPAPAGEVYQTNINGAPGTTTVRRVVSTDGVICVGTENESFSNTYTIQDPSVVKLASQYKVDDYYSKQYYGLDCKLMYHEYKGLRQGKTKVTHKSINKETGEVWDSTDYYMEVDANMNLYIFLPGNGVEH